MMYSNDTVINLYVFKQPVYSTSKDDTLTHNTMGSKYVNNQMNCVLEMVQWNFSELKTEGTISKWSKYYCNLYCWLCSPAC
jgi:hypothetical protein